MICGASWRETAQKPKPKPIAIARSEAAVQNLIPLESVRRLTGGTVAGFATSTVLGFIKKDDLVQ
jgi:hypothetical protein